ncbi:MAG: EAL domain-containing protein [Xanthomonadaceae bacterium]|nr:EAL domain-containing protein [Xanthomonadaceae bacterium]
MAPASAPAASMHLRVVTDNNYPPFLFIDADGRPRGLEVDRWRLFEQHTGIKVDLVPMQWDRAQRELLSGRADVIDMIFRTPSRESLYDFSAPYATLPVGIYVDRRILGVRDAASLRGFPVGVQRGDACVEKLHALGVSDLRLLANYSEVMQAAIHGDMRIFCMDEYPANFYLYRNAALDRFHRAFELYSGQFHWAVRKGNRAVLERVERGMALITPAEQARIRDRWLEKPMAITPYLRPIAIGALITALAMALLGFWVWILRRAVARRTRELVAGQRRLQALFDASPDAMWVKGHDGIYRDCNDRVEQLLGVGRQVLLGRTVQQLFDTELAGRVEAMDREVLQTGAPRIEILPLRQGDGTVRQLEVIKVPMPEPDGSATSVLSVARDITCRLEDEARLRLWGQAFEHAAFGVKIYDVRTQRITAVNPTFARERGYAPAEMAGMPIDALYPADLGDLQRRARHAAEQRDHSLLESEHVTRDGRRFPVLLDRSVVRDDEGRPQFAVVYAQDISERKRVDSELRLAAVAFQTQEALMVTSAAGTIQRVNAAFVALSGYAPDEVLGKRPSMLGTAHHDHDYYLRIWRQVHDDGYWQGEQWIAGRDGVPRVVQMAISSVKDDAGHVSHYICTMTDLTREREAIEYAEHLTFFDALTDLPNRRYLHGQIEHLLEGEGSGGALLMLDLDHFKRVNDLRGHEAGDRLLWLVAMRLRPLLDEGCLLSRFSGDTFALLAACPSVGPADRMRRAMDCAGRVRSAMQSPFQLDDDSRLSMTCSIGVTEVVPGQGSAAVVFKEAEMAMYAAKRAGRDRIVPFAPSMMVDMERSERVAEELHDAIATDALQLHLQLQVDRSGRPIGAEALMRWYRANGESVAPCVFIPIAEERGLIGALGEWALRRACMQLVEWAGSTRTRGLVLAVNVSAHQFARPGFVEGVTAMLAETGANPARLELELTESALVSDLAWVASRLDGLRRLGVRVSLDDFGTGYSSLAYLSRLPLDQLKIDQSFVGRLPEVAGDATVSQTIIAMGHGLGLQVIAEGVETEAQWSFLMEHGCDAFQGYLLGRPMPAAEFDALLARIEMMG